MKTQRRLHQEKKIVPAPAPARRGLAVEPVHPAVPRADGAGGERGDGLRRATPDLVERKPEVRGPRPPQISSSWSSERPHRSHWVTSSTLPFGSSPPSTAACISPPHGHGSGYSSQHSGPCRSPTWWLGSSPTVNRS